MQQSTLPLQKTSSKTSLGHGDVLNGRYRIESIIDRGGMGIVLGARHVRLDERVAIKVLLPESSANPTVVARFLREGQLIAQVKSDHVVRVLDVDVMPTGLPFLVMEWLDGQDLRSFCRSRKTERLEIGFAVRCIVDACQALDAAHALGIVHRDIKPSNLFLTRGPRGSVRVKLIEFGISKQEVGARDERTKTGMVLGTTEYMAPEQIHASNLVDARADIWSLGVTLYKLVTGRTPFRSGEAMSTYALIVGASPTLPSTLCPELPAELEAIIMKCLEKDPAKRFESVRDLGQALAPFAEREEKTTVLEAVRAPHSQRTTISRKPLVQSTVPAKPTPRRTWGVVSAVFALALALVGVLFVGIHRAQATSIGAQRIASVWQAPTTPLPLVVQEKPSPVEGSASNLPSPIPKPLARPVSSAPRSTEPTAIAAKHLPSIATTAATTNQDKPEGPPLHTPEAPKETTKYPF